MKKISNKNILITILLILLLALSIGYATFSDILTISGTANAKGTFDLEFQNAEVVKNVGADIEKTTAVISEDKDTLTVNVADLSYPGSGVEFAVDIVNVGTIPAEVQAVTPTNITGSNKIKVTGLEVIKTDHPKIAAGDKCNIHFTVEWPIEAGEILENESNISFGLEIEYVQSTGEAFDEKDPIIPEYTVPMGLTATYGDILANIELPEGFEFQDSLETPVGNAGTNSFLVTYTSESNKEIKDIEISIEVEKANPNYIVPTGLTTVYGNTLSNIKLPEGFKFQDLLETTVGNVGTNKFKITYTPVDTDNYNEIKDIEISITVKYDTLVNQITSQDYGKSINYVATVKNTKISNWKVLYNDKSNIYLILDDFLPNNLVPASAGLNTSGTYGVYANTSRDVLLNGLRTASYWSEFANGVTGAIAWGAPKFDMLMKSYNEKHNTSINTNSTNTVARKLDNKDTLYISHTSEYNGIRAYYLATEYPSDAISLWGVPYTGSLDYYWHYYTPSYAGLRPVVSLPSSITGTVGEKIEIK